MYYLLLTVLLGLLIASLGVGFALGSRLPDLEDPGRSERSRTGG